MVCIIEGFVGNGDCKNGNIFKNIRLHNISSEHAASIRRFMRTKNYRQKRVPKRDQINQNRIQAVLTCLAARFPQYSSEDILFSLSRKLEQDRQMDRNRQHFQEYFDPNHEDSQDDYDRQLPVHRYNRDVNYPQQIRRMAPSLAQKTEQRLVKHEQLKMVAIFFCSLGDDYEPARDLFVGMTQQKHTSFIHHINRETLKSMTNYIRFQCNIVIETMSTEQKNILVPKLKKVRTWLGERSSGNLQTYYKLIKRQFIDHEVDINYDEVLSLFKTLMEVAKAQSVDILRILEDVPNNTPPPYIESEKSTAPLSSYTKDQEKTIVSTFIKEKNLKKVAKFMTDCQEQQNKNKKKWAANSIKELLVYVLKKALKKVIITKDANIKKVGQVQFLESDSLANKIFNSNAKTILRDKLFSFYLVNRITSTELLSMIKEINEFYGSNEEQVSVANFIDKNEEISIIPKVQFDDNIEKSTAASTIKRQNQRSRVPPNNIIIIKEEPVQNASKSIEDLETLPDENEKKEEFVEVTYDSKLCNMVIEIIE